jgi:hypothetical protein
MVPIGLLACAPQEARRSAEPEEAVAAAGGAVVKRSEGGGGAGGDAGRAAAPSAGAAAGSVGAADDTAGSSGKDATPATDHGATVRVAADAATDGAPAGASGDAPAGDLARRERSDAAAPPPAGRGREVLWFDHDVTFDGGRPGEKNPLPSWRTPVDYLGGRIELRAVVKQKPDATPIWHELIFWQGAPGTPHVLVHCFDADELARPGLTTCSDEPPQKADKVDLARAYAGTIQHSAKVASPNGGRGTTELSGNRAPMVVRMTAVLVPAGQRFSGWTNYPLDKAGTP